MKKLPDPKQLSEKAEDVLIFMLWEELQKFLLEKDYLYLNQFLQL